jgi:hypothetical protein
MHAAGMNEAYTHAVLAVTIIMRYEYITQVSKLDRPPPRTANPGRGSAACHGLVPHAPRPRRWHHRSYAHANSCASNCTSCTRSV